MDISLFKILGALVSPAKWLYGLCVDQTRIIILTPVIKDRARESLPVKNNGSDAGLLLFSVTTRSKKPVEITRIEVNYAAPLQLLDPENRGFFVGSATLDTDLPFRIAWEGSAIVRSDLQQGFALIAQFSNAIHKQRIAISIYARRQHTVVGGFLAQGRSRITTKEYQAYLTSEPILGLTVPPKSSITTPQPFLIERALDASGGPGPMVIHERMSDGHVSSTHVGLPGA